ncbi:hypothetical protein AG1IA_00403 [Rhizoctonia solani AG-1 IA]|uniref:Uncharacterized protein n=1 Tax=Thanatephorus cucumeris (strain AG1-IA) TaxID=983506 RepID=L8X5N6_THACA|nr:hypothetical protein AG1IA_00403 [Rhizoctonia solani AG-1 IA]
MSRPHKRYYAKATRFTCRLGADCVSDKVAFERLLLMFVLLSLGLESSAFERPFSPWCDVFRASRRFFSCCLTATLRQERVKNTNLRDLFETFFFVREVFEIGLFSYWSLGWAFHTGIFGVIDSLSGHHSDRRRLPYIFHVIGRMLPTASVSVVSDHGVGSKRNNGIM